MKNEQKTPASAINASGHREQALEKLLAHRAAACTGETRLLVLKSNQRQTDYGSAALPTELTSYSFMPPLSYANAQASHHFYMGKDLVEAHEVLLTSQKFLPNSIHIRVRRAYPFPTNYLYGLVRICHFLTVQQQLLPRQICCYRTSPIFSIMVPFANYRTIVPYMSKHLFLTGIKTNV